MTARRQRQGGGATDADIAALRVTPGALVLLVKMLKGARLQESVKARIPFVLFHHDYVERGCAHAVRRLSALGFIERNCVLPPDCAGIDCDWEITAAGRSWIVANTLDCGKIGQLRV
jgi:hypothetical protein